MNEVAKVQRELCPALTQREAQIVRATTEVRVKNSRKTALAEIIDSVVGTCLITLGTDKKKHSEKDLFLIKKEIVNDIYTNFNNLTFEEIRLAFAYGSRGEYKTKPDQIIYFSVSTVYHWLKSYIANTKREAMQKQARYEQDKLKPRKVSEDEKKKIEAFFVSEYILKPYRRYFETGEYLFDNRGNVIYNTLDKMKVIPFSVERKKEIFERAKLLILAQMEQYPGPETKNRMNHIKEGKGRGHEEVVSHAKDLALQEFFKELKEQGMLLEDFMELRKT